MTLQCRSNQILIARQDELPMVNLTLSRVLCPETETQGLISYMIQFKYKRKHR